MTRQRFDEVGEQQPNRSLDYCYRGFNYRITVGEQEFQVRTAQRSRQSLKPTPVERLGSAFTVDILNPAWLSSHR